MAKEEFEAWVSKLSPEAKEHAEGFFSVIRRSPDNKLQNVPYSDEYTADLARAGRLLREAAAFTDNASLKKFLSTRARGAVDPKTLDELIAKLDSKEASERQKACQELVAIGVPALAVDGTLPMGTHEDPQPQNFYAFTIGGTTPEEMSFLLISGNNTLNPNPVLVPITLVGGYILTRVFFSTRNLIPLALSQAIIGSLLTVALPFAWHHGLRVGPGYYRWN